MNRRQILKSALFAPLLGLFKRKREKKEPAEEYLSPTARMHKAMIETGWGDQEYKASLTTGTSGEEVLLGKAVWNREEPLLAPLTVPKGESWTVTNIVLEDDMVYYYGYIIYDGY